MTVQKTILLFGVAGSGKTTKCLELIKDFISKGYAIDDICFTTYTKAGIASIKEKLEKSDIFLPEENNFNTLHSICWRLAGLNKPLNYYDFCSRNNIRYKTSSEEEEKTLGEFVEETYEKIQNTTGKSIKSFKPHQIDSLINRLYETDELVTLDLKMQISYGIKQLLKYKKENETHTYSDAFVEVLKREIDMPTKVLIVDEAQDLFDAQIKVVQLWTEKYSKDIFVLAGDDCQAIHGYAGSSPEFLINYSNNNLEKIILEQSHRCPEKITDFCNLVLKRIKIKQDKKMIPCKKGGQVNLINFPQNIQEFAQRIPLNTKTFLLFRTNKLMKVVAEMMFQQTNIPFSYISTRVQSFYSLKFCLIHNAVLKLSKEKEVSFEEACKLIGVLKTEQLHKGVKTNFKKNKMLQSVSFEEFTSNILKWTLHLHSEGFDFKRELINNIVYDRVTQDVSDKTLNRNDLIRRKLMMAREPIKYRKVLVGGRNKIEVARLPVQFGTFHSSKGLQAHTSFVFLGTNKYFAEINDNEYRCLYVASSRSKEVLNFVITHWDNEEFELANAVKKILDEEYCYEPS